MQTSKTAPPAGDTAIPALLASASFGAAMNSLAQTHERFIGELVTLTEIPSPPFKEEVRGQAYRDMLEAAGLMDVAIDSIGNVTGVRRGKVSGGRMIAVSAHLDTVFPEGTDVTVRREGFRLSAPGVGDNTRGLAVILAYLRALDAAGMETRDDILVLASVGEEGEGDLRGMRHFFANSAYRDRIAALVCLDGPTPANTVVSAGTGSKRYRVTFRGPGGHSFADHGIVNPMIAAARAVVELGRLSLPDDPKTTCSSTVIKGGSSVNAIPAEVSLMVDLRSNSAFELADLDARFREIVLQSCHVENDSRSIEKGIIAVEIALIGDRPAGGTVDGELTRSAAAAIAAIGQAPVFSSFSTDANVAMSLGVPAITLSWGGKGGDAHSLTEWTDVDPATTLPEMSVGLAVLLACAGADIK
ncbi:acetylornithine deacetylase/succinyl-diaminopimelate desuccinylase-like protein [Neorhizobium sp. 2083]|uniref:M20/M25/M40 family metallo-hydrolase n=1 Tax=Neorhizobium sp. 2083 TaxID=2817762 RepID=UPI00285727D7|nr:M20/M25/M40 family metallo-hydrolase [Neorhizobium sp. 2083]MDR6817892.1 acetylornithine deacetylase/succinyl-diaminopimelate desuccinylase-like protein [Neorhizobium sp. 2083]